MEHIPFILPLAVILTLILYENDSTDCNANSSSSDLKGGKTSSD